MCVCVQFYLVEDAGSYESTAGIEGPGATHVQVRLIKRLQNSQEVRTIQLFRDTDAHKESSILPQCSNLQRFILECSVTAE